MSDKQMFKELKESVISLDRERVKKVTQDALNQGLSTQDIISRGLVEGMQVIGDGFERREMFLPELIAAGEAMKSAFSILRPHMIRAGVRAEGKVVLGTVQGDIHDIGKNIVSALLEGSGFEVYDVGVDVPADVFIKKAQEVEPDIVALSAMLSVTVSRMVETVIILKENNIQAKIVIGGAATNQVVADEMGADAYGKDAWEGVQKIQQLVKARRQK
ncbi:MAG: corrinoid protein [Chloroflexi bacterium]|nr:corrinoid protein [Chloroflexota bacterium]